MVSWPLCHYVQSTPEPSPGARWPPRITWAGWASNPAHTRFCGGFIECHRSSTCGRCLILATAIGCQVQGQSGWLTQCVSNRSALPGWPVSHCSIGIGEPCGHSSHFHCHISRSIRASMTTPASQLFTVLDNRQMHPHKEQNAAKSVDRSADSRAPCLSHFCGADSMSWLSLSASQVAGRLQSISPSLVAKSWPKPRSAHTAGTSWNRSEHCHLLCVILPDLDSQSSTWDLRHET